MEKNNKDTKQKRKEIFNEIFISEEDTLNRLEELIKKSKEYFKIKSPSGKIIFNRNRTFSNMQKIALFLIGKYFASEGELINKKKFTMREIADKLDILITTLSSPLGNLVDSNIVKKEDEEYEIEPHEIENFLDNMTQPPKGSLVKSKRSGKNSKKNSKSISEKLPEPKEKGIKKLTEKLEIEKKDLYRIFDFDEDVNLLFLPEGDNEEEKQFKATILILTAYKYYFGKKEIGSSNLRKKLDDLGIISLANLSTNLKEYKQFIRHKRGKRGNTKTSYKITIPGIEKGKKIIKKIVGEERPENE